MSQDRKIDMFLVSVWLIAVQCRDFPYSRGISAQGINVQGSLSSLLRLPEWATLGLVTYGMAVFVLRHSFKENPLFLLQR